ncbi:MAG: NADH-quinone oxidoreductase subunit C [Nitrospirae bacterium]|nr:NADH-quinone oxidoreductase subunit C [Nitrospirota bacterium]
MTPELIIERVKKRFAGAVLSTKVEFGEGALSIKREFLLDVCRFLHDEPELYFDFITDVCSVDFIGQEERFEVVYHLYSVRHNHRIRIKARVPENDAVIDSLCVIWKGANWPEREVYDLMGINFKGHPDMRRILMPDDFTGHPLRKDYPTEGRGERSTFDFIPDIN